MQKRTTRELTGFRVAPDVLKAMRVIKREEGIPMAVQIEFAMRAWFKSRKATRRR
jgi:hypothetical protein